MTTIKDLIQETEKGCGIIFDYKHEKFGLLRMECGVWQRMNTPELWQEMQWCPTCRAKLETLKQCQTIADEKTKDFINVLQWIYTNIGTEDDEDASVMIRIDKYINTLKQQLNPAQTEE